MEKAVTLVKNLQPEVLPVTKDKYDGIRLIILGNDTIPGGTMSDTAQCFLEKCGFAVDIYQPFEDDLHGTSEEEKLYKVIARE